MTSRTLIRVQYLARVTAPQIDPKTFEEEDVAHYSIPSVQENAGPIVEKASSIDSNKLQLKGHEVLVSRLNPHKNTVIQVKQNSLPILCSTEFIPFEPTGIEPRFLCYSFQGQISIQHLVAYASSATRSHARVDPSDIIKFKIPVFQREEQSAIADYLDHETARIDELIHEKERMLELLAEKRAALVTQFVTRGLDSKVRLKPSGLDWLGEIPAHWRVERLKFHLLGRIEQGWSPQCDNREAEDDEWGVLKVGCVNGNNFDPQENKALPTKIEPEARYEVSKDDILLSRGNTPDLVGKASLVPKVRPRLLLCDLLYRCRVDPKSVIPEFVVHQLRSLTGRYQIERDAVGSSGSMKKIGQETIQNFIVTLPSIEEQSQILTSLAARTSRIDTITETTLQSIRLLRERRSAVITAAVTGQLAMEEMIL